MDNPLDAWKGLGKNTKLIVIVGAVAIAAFLYIRSKKTAAAATAANAAGANPTGATTTDPNAAYDPNAYYPPSPSSPVYGSGGGYGYGGPTDSSIIGDLQSVLAAQQGGVNTGSTSGGNNAGNLNSGGTGTSTVSPTGGDTTPVYQDPVPSPGFTQAPAVGPVSALVTGGGTPSASPSKLPPTAANPYTAAYMRTLPIAQQISLVQSGAAPESSLGPNAAAIYRAGGTSTKNPTGKAVSSIGRSL